MKILVTGANGYLGQGVVKALLDNGHSVVAADFKTNYVNMMQQKGRDITLRKRNLMNTSGTSGLFWKERIVFS